ncbi:MAG: PP2C family protein-serine/threonine phosphatase [Planctomycetota bacterium]
MSRGARSGGMSLANQFALGMGLALAVVMGVALYFLFSTTQTLVTRSVSDARDEAARLTSGLAAGEGGPSVRFEQASNTGASVGADLVRLPIKFTHGPRAGEPGFVWLAQGEGRSQAVMVAPAPQGGEEGPARTLYQLFIVVSAVVLLVGVVVAYVIAQRVARPIEVLADDVRTIARGNLRHRTRAQGGGEVSSLASAIDRMAASLAEAQEAEIELGVRERERAVALEVQEALLPQRTPNVPGYAVAARYMGAAEPGGDFYDFIEAADGRLVALVADVSGAGVPAALIGGTARAYLRIVLSQGGDLASALVRANREIARDVRRGMAVTALVVVLDPRTGELEVASAGHKLPLLVSSRGKLGKVHPEGIALGFDKGPIFERGLAVKRISLAPGDSVVLAGTGVVLVQAPSGEEVGDERYLRLVARNSRDVAQVALDGICAALETHADGEPFPSDVSLIVLARDA